MKKFNKNHLDWSDEKKERKIKNHHDEEICKCFAPFLKLHWHDCPLVNKPCPIHGSHIGCDVIEKEETEQNVTISFYPSSKTERLFQPVRSLLAQCNPDTKINLQYFSPKDFPSRGNFKHQLIQTSSEDLKTVLNSNVFVEKSKSFTTDKTNKMKKLRQCFHSPCNSIAKKNRSQISFNEKMNEIFRDESQHRNAIFNMNLEEPRDGIKYDSSFEWLCPSKVGLENLEKLSDERRDSDFITFTQRCKNNIINHKIFEIKHKKGLNDMSNIKISKQPTEFVYTSFAGGLPVKEPADSYQKENKNTIIRERKPPNESETAPKKHGTSSTSGNSQSSSSGSVYVTPFFFMPMGVEDSESDHPKPTKTDEGTLVQDAVPQKESEYAKKTYDAFQRSGQEESRVKSVSLQTESSMEEKHSQCTREVFLHDYEPSMDTVDEKFEDRLMKTLGEDFSDYSCWRKKLGETLAGKNEASKYTRTTEVQTSSSYRYKEVVVSTRCNRDQTSQTETYVSETRQKGFESKSKQIQITHQTHISKETQTSFPDSATDSDASKLDLDSCDAVRFMDEGDQDKSLRFWWRKSLSESELFDKKKCACSKFESPVHLSQNCCCKCSNVTPNVSCTRDYGLPNTVTKIFETNPQVFESANLSDNVSSPPQKPVAHLSKAEQTSLNQEDCADLSELKKIIQEFFEKRDPSSGKKADDDTPRAKKGKIDQSTTTGSQEFVKKNIVDEETQTTVHVLMDDAMEDNHTRIRGQRVKFRQSILLDDENQTKTFFICALCGREINRFSVHASTNTENSPSHLRAKEKTTIVDTKINEIITVKTIKKSQNSDYSTSSSKSEAKPVGGSLNDSTTKTIRSQNSPQAINHQRSGIPILISGPPAHLKYDETIIKTENINMEPMDQESLQPLNKKSTSTQVKAKSKSQKPLATTQSSKQCICNEVAGTSGSKTFKASPSSSLRLSKVRESRTRQQADYYSSLTRIEHPGMASSHWRNTERSTTDKGNQKKAEEYFYPVIVNSFWPREFMRTWESMEKYDNRWGITNQKRSYEMDVEPAEIPAEKRIKPLFDEFLKDYFVFGKPSFSDLFRKEKQTTLGKNTGFIWVPSSSLPQISSHNSILKQSKSAKSEEFLKIPQQQGNPAQLEKTRRENLNEIFTVKSCHLKPITFKSDEQSFNKLFECSFCKSLTFLNSDERDVSCLKSNTSHQPGTPERNPSKKVLEEPTQGGPLQYNESSNYSDNNEIPESLENNISEEEITELFKENYSQSNSQRPKLQSESQILHIFDTSFNSDVATTSKSLNTFWFGRDTKKNFFQKPFK